MNEPRVYKNSPFIFGFLILIFGVFFVGLLANLGQSNWYMMVPFGLVFGLIFLISFISISSRTIISEDEISTQNLFGTKSLRWSEINQVSGRGYAIKLQDMDRYLTVTPSPQLPGYPEVIEWIGLKRPDLFSSMEYTEMTRSWLGTILLPTIGLLIMGVGVFIFTRSDDTLFPLLIFLAMGIVFLAISLTLPQAVTIQGNTIVISYLFNQKTLLADEIASVDLRFTQTRNGKNYFVALNLVNRKTIRISGLNPNLPVVYLVLKNWHRKNTGNI